MTTEPNGTEADDSTTRGTETNWDELTRNLVGADPATAVLILADMATDTRDVLEGTQGQLAALAPMVGKDHAMLAELMPAIAALTAKKKKDSTLPPRWAELDAAETDRQMDALTEWMNAHLRATTPAVAKVVPGCWDKHADVIDLLSALRAAWEAAYSKDAGASTAAVDYLTRWAPQVEAAISKASGSCKGTHTPTKVPEPFARGT